MSILCSFHGNNWFGYPTKLPTDLLTDLFFFHRRSPSAADDRTRKCSTLLRRTGKIQLPNNRFPINIDRAQIGSRIRVYYRLLFDPAIGNSFGSYAEPGTIILSSRSFPRVRDDDVGTPELRRRRGEGERSHMHLHWYDIYKSFFDSVYDWNRAF